MERTNWKSEQGYNFIKLVIGLFKNVKAVADTIVSFPNHSYSKTRVQLASDLKFCGCVGHGMCRHLYNVGSV